MDRSAHHLTLATRRRLLADLAALVAVPTVSAELRHAPDCRRGAEWLVRRLQEAGLPEVALLETGGPPLVVGSVPASTGAGQARDTRGPQARPPHVLFYGHYDVQPVDPAQWSSPPFRLTLRGSDVVGRGAADDKGPVLAHVLAVEQLLTRRALPVRVTVLLDGEEEVGSPHLAAALDGLARRLQPDVVLISDTRMVDTDQPALVRSLRGSVTLDLVLRTAHPALHAGAWGGAVRGAASEMADLLSRLHAPDGSLAVPGPERHLRPVGHPRDHVTRPAITVTWLHAGGAATAVPDVARARLNLRTVLGQDPVVAASRTVAHLCRGLRPGSRLHVTRGPAVPAVEADVDGAGGRAAVLAYRDGFGRTPVITRSGGTIPAVAQLREAFGAPVVLMGFTPPDARIHAADEHLHLPVLWRAVRTASRCYTHVARQLSGRARAER